MIRRSLLVTYFILRYHLSHQENPHSSGWGFPGGVNGKEPACQCRRRKRCGFDPWVGKIPWRRAWQTTLVFLPGESHRHRSLVGYSSWGHRELDMTEWITFSSYWDWSDWEHTHVVAGICQLHGIILLILPPACLWNINYVSTIWSQNIPLMMRIVCMFSVLYFPHKGGALSPLET